MIYSILGIVVGTTEAEMDIQAVAEVMLNTELSQENPGTLTEIQRLENQGTPSENLIKAKIIESHREVDPGT